MEALEVPFWVWGANLDPALVAALVDAADAANDQATALAGAHLARLAAGTAAEQARRGTLGGGPHRRSAAGDLADLTREHTERLTRLYARTALRFAALAAGAVVDLASAGTAAGAAAGASAGVAAGDQARPDPALLLVSDLYRDASVLPAPPPSLDGQHTEELAGAYREVMATRRLGLPATAEQLRQLDVDAPPPPAATAAAGPAADPDTGVWRMAGADLAQQLHAYGHLCLWRIATRPDIVTG